MAAKCNWSVLNNTMGSDHCPTVITFNAPVYGEATGIPRWKVELADWQLYKENSRALITSDLIMVDVDICNANVVEAISKAAESSIPQTKPS